MQQPLNPVSGGDAETAALGSLFTHAADAGRSILDTSELNALLAHLGVGLDREGSQLAPAIDVRISLNNTREFGMVISAGLGGLESELDEDNFRKDRAAVYASAELTDAEDFLGLFRRTLAYQKLAGMAQRQGRPLPDTRLAEVFGKLLTLAKYFSPTNAKASCVLQNLELNPVHCAEQLLVRAARCEIGVRPAGRLDRPIHKIDKLLHPASIGIIGVSGSGMNFGRIILRNLMGSGYPKEQMTIIRPGETEIDGVKCAASLKTLDHKLDLLIVAIAASAVYDLVDEIIATDSVESVMLLSLIHI